MARCFTDHAVVRDEGRTVEGLTAIKQWNSETQKKYPRAFNLEFVFGLERNKIASLEIHA